MSHARLCKAVATTLLGTALAAPAVALDLLGPDCLEKLSDRTRLWAECTHQFERTDSRCKKPAAQMHAYMQKCARKGESKAAIDAAMTDGYRLAGERTAATKDAPPAAPATSGRKTQNLLTKYAKSKDSPDAE